jgi:2-polyprenyl-3-methyl-5-hydroxy-6-metoxy-1,4-benzoquinol methylase
MSTFMPVSNTRTDEARQVAEYWDRIAPEFDSIYAGNKNLLARRLDHWLRRDMYQRFDWVMREAEQLRPATVCDIGCGSGRFVGSVAKYGAHVTGVDFAPEMLKLAGQLVERDGVADRCKFVQSDVLDWKTSEVFDLVIAIGFWDYVADPMGRLQVIRKLTGRTFLSAWPRHGTMRMAIRKVRLKVAGCPVYFWRQAEVESYLNRAGFQAESCEVLGQLYCIRARPV